jgi:cystathionine beta-lyase/cystathionine gamma-synthase
LDWGADLVLESVTKIINGHSDVTLGLLAGRSEFWDRVPSAAATWGLVSSPFDCWLALRGMASLALRCERACENARKSAEFLAAQPQVERVDYPGLPGHPDHALASQQFGGRFGWMVAFHLRGGRAAADALIDAARDIPFCPSLGEISTTLSHPESTSHRGLSPQERANLGISGGTIRLSVGCESSEFILKALERGLSNIG